MNFITKLLLVAEKNTILVVYNTLIPTTINLRTKDSNLAFLINPWSLNDNPHSDQLTRVYTE